jgi:hypothetical protein
MTGHTVCSYFVLVVSRGIIGVVACLGVAGLADTIPGFTVLIEGKVIRSLLKDSKVQRTVNMLWFFPYKAQVGGLCTGVGIGGCIYTVRIMAGPTIYDSIPTIDKVVADIGHGFRLTPCTVALLTFSLLLFTTGNFDYKDTTLNQVVVAVTAADCITGVVGGSLSWGTRRKKNH